MCEASWDGYGTKQVWHPSFTLLVLFENIIITHACFMVTKIIIKIVPVQSSLHVIPRHVLAAQPSFDVSRTYPETEIPLVRVEGLRCSYLKV